MGADSDEIHKTKNHVRKEYQKFELFVLMIEASKKVEIKREMITNLPYYESKVMSAIRYDFLYLDETARWLDTVGNDADGSVMKAIEGKVKELIRFEKIRLATLDGILKFVPDYVPRFASLDEMAEKGGLGYVIEALNLAKLEAAEEEAERVPLRLSRGKGSMEDIGKTDEIIGMVDNPLARGNLGVKKKKVKKGMQENIRAKRRDLKHGDSSRSQSPQPPGITPPPPSPKPPGDGVKDIEMKETVDKSKEEGGKSEDKDDPPKPGDDVQEEIREVVDRSKEMD